MTHNKVQKMIRLKEHLTSAKNPGIKNLIALQKPRERRNQGVFVIEGMKEIEKAHTAGYEFLSIYFCPEKIRISEIEKFAQNTLEVFPITAGLFEKVTYRGNTGGIIVIARPKQHGIESLFLKENPLLIILESVEKPGNLGAILRTADAAGVDAVIVCDQQTDIYNPNVIRSSIGCLFTVPLFTGTSNELIKLLENNNINIYCTALTASLPYHKINFTGPSAIVLGAESTGLSRQWLDISTQNIIIPMAGIADSLNVSTSAAIVIFEAKRQRGFSI